MDSILDQSTLTTSVFTFTSTTVASQPGFLQNKKQSIETLLSAVWSKFGMVTDTYYHAEFSFGFVTFQTHEQAKSALAGFKDPAQLRKAIDEVVAAQTNEEAKKYASDLANQLFVARAGQLILPSWATPRRR
jgi:hypothetical protein